MAQNGDYLRDAREAAGLTQQGLADIVGVHRVTLANWELGEHHPTLPVAITLARALGTTVEDLFGDIAYRGQREPD